jgi:16S rRNA (guanine527-N7)-methyltransferase
MANNAIKKLGGELLQVIEYKIPDIQELTRNLAVVKKIKNTPQGYPRKIGVPKKTPIL